MPANRHAGLPSRLTPAHKAPHRRRLSIESLERRNLLTLALGLDPSFKDPSGLQGNGVGTIDFGFPTPSGLPPGGAGQGVTAVAFDHGAADDGKIVVVGTVDDQPIKPFGVARLNPDGTPDVDFGVNGKVTVPFVITDGKGLPMQLSAEATSVAVQPDGKIVVAGSVDAGASHGGKDFAVMRIDTDGRLDPSFGPKHDGLASVGFNLGGDDNDVASAVAIDDQGNIVLSGVATDAPGHSVPAAARLTSDGLLDTSFGDHGLFHHDLGSSATITCMALQTLAGRQYMVLGGSVQPNPSAGSHFAVTRLTPSGTVDATFADNGEATFGFEAWAYNSEASRIAIDSQNRIVLAGRAINGSTRNLDIAIVRLASNGSVDGSRFGPPDGATFPQSSPQSSPQSYQMYVNGLGILADDDIAVAAVRTGGDLPQGASDIRVGVFSSDATKEDRHFDFVFRQGEVILNLVSSLTVDPHNRDRFLVAGACLTHANNSAAIASILAVDKPRPLAIEDRYVISDAASSTALVDQPLTANDANPAGADYSIVNVSKPAHGSVTVEPSGAFSYTKGPDFAGFDSFTYQLQSGGGLSNTASVTVMTHDAALVRKLYREVLNRNPEDGGWSYWTTLIGQGHPLSLIAEGIYQSKERIDPIIRQYYHDYLFREADVEGLAFWRDQVWIRDGGPSNVIAGVITSAEFNQSTGNSHGLWVKALYQRLLNRPFDPDGLQYWTGVLDAGTATETQVSLGFINSKENYTNLVDGWFEKYLDRLPAPAEAVGFVLQMQHGSSQRQIQDEIIDSVEYHRNPPTEAVGAAERLTGVGR